jgi:hypothetical protein
LLATYGKAVPTAGDFFGAAIAGDAGQVLVGAPFDAGGGLPTGAAYPFDAASSAIVHEIPNPPLRCRRGARIAARCRYAARERLSSNTHVVLRSLIVGPDHLYTARMRSPRAACVRLGRSKSDACRAQLEADFVLPDHLLPRSLAMSEQRILAHARRLPRGA